MGKLKTYRVLSTIRRSGKLYKPGTDNDTIELDEKEADRFKALGCIDDGEEGFEVTVAKTVVALSDILKALREDGHDVASMNMAELKPLIGDQVSDVKRKDVDAALEKIAATAKE